MPPRIRYFLPSIAQSLFVIVFLHLSLKVGRQLLVDCDTGFHIKAGEYMLDTRSIPKHDPFSLFSPPMPWPTHEWLSDVLMAAINIISGLTGVVIFFIFIISIAYSLLFKILRANEGNIFVDIFLIVLVLITSQMHWLARPHMFTLLLLMVWYYIIDSFQNGRKNLLYLLPLIMLLWINLHGGFILGFILIVIYIAYNLEKLYISKNTDKELHKWKVKCLFLATIASVLFSLANPKGFHTLLFPLEVVSNRLIMDNYGEFLSPNFHSVPFIPFKYFLLLMIAFLGAFKEKLNPLEIFLILVFTNMALFSARYIPLFAVIVAPILSRQGNGTLHNFNNKLSNLIINKAIVQESIDKSARGYIWPIVAIVIVVGLAASNRIKFEFDEKIKPVNAVEFLKKEHIPGNMFNNDEFGDYIIYSAYPQYKVFFDSRADIYGNEKLKDYLDVIKMRRGWEKVLEKYDINWIIFDAYSPLSQYLSITKDWRLIYSDSVADIYIKDIKKNKNIINKYGGVK
jgi:hypothetical protein